MKLHRQIKSELTGQEEIEIFIHKRAKPRKERKTASEMKRFQRYLSSINKGSLCLRASKDSRQKVQKWA